MRRRQAVDGGGGTLITKVYTNLLNEQPSTIAKAWAFNLQVKHVDCDPTPQELAYLY
jgi:hypothetical protein